MMSSALGWISKDVVLDICSPSFWDWGLMYILDIRVGLPFGLALCFIAFSSSPLGWIYTYFMYAQELVGFVFPFRLDI